MVNSKVFVRSINPHSTTIIKAYYITLVEQHFEESKANGGKGKGEREKGYCVPPLAAVPPKHSFPNSPILALRRADVGGRRKSLRRGVYAILGV